MKTYDITIIGGGMVGLSCAALLSKHHFSIAVIESSEFSFVENELTARVSAIHLASQKLFHYLDIWNDVAKNAAPLREMKIWDHTQKAHLHFDSSEIDKTELGWIVANQEISQSLYKKLSQENNVEFFCPNTPTDFLMNNNVVMLTLQNGEKIQTNVIVGADGAHSWVRKQMDIHTRTRSYYQKAIIAVIESSLTHDFCAIQKFLTTGPVALLPLKNLHHTALVWSADDAMSDALMQKAHAEFDTALTDALDCKLGKLKSISNRQQFPLLMRHADEYVSDHFALIGDAAHTIHPLAGLGVNLGLMDAACLAQVLIDARSIKKSLHTFQTLRRYTRWRKSENTAMIASMRALKELFAIDTSWFNIARGAGVNFIDQSNCLKNSLMRMVTGDHGDQPGFLKDK